MRKIWGVLFCVILLGGCANQARVNMNPAPLTGIHFPPGYAARVSSYDRTGHNADALRVLPGETAVLADIKGSGIIRHIWSTTNASGPYGRNLILRMYWDGSLEPAVEVPYGDFFAQGHALVANVNSLPISVGSSGRARNCWWSMPFENSAKVTLTNEGDQTVSAFYYYIDYLALESPPSTNMRFHCQYRQACPADFPENYTILQTEGMGSYLGCIMNVESTKPNWWGEGDDVIEVDGNPTLYGTGTEDYFCDAWGMREQLFPFHGATICEGYDAEGRRSTMYRFHILDPIPFQYKIKVSIEHGSENDRADNLSSVAFWYQVPPAATFPPLPDAIDRISGEKRVELIRERAWRLANSQESDATQKLEDLLTRAKTNENQVLISGLVSYVQGKANPDEQTLKKLESFLKSLKKKMDSMPKEELYIKPEMDMPTDDDSLVPGPLVSTYTVLERARHDLARKVALERGFMPGDEIIVEARDALGIVTPAPTYEETPDFTNSYAKVEDTRLMGSGARFTYGNADPSWARFTPDFPRTGRYEVFVIFSYGSNAADTRYEARHANGVKTTPLPQRGRLGTPDRNNKKWHSLGIYQFEKGQNAEKGSVTLHASPGTEVPNDKFEYRAYSDSVRFVYKGSYNRPG